MHPCVQEAREQLGGLREAISGLKSELASTLVERASMENGLGAQFSAAEEERLKLQMENEVGEACYE